MSLPDLIFLAVSLFGTVYAAKRVADAVRDRSVGWGTRNTLYIKRSSNPFAFWFSVAILALGSVAFGSVAYTLASGLLAAA